MSEEQEKNKPNENENTPKEEAPIQGEENTQQNQEQNPEEQAQAQNNPESQEPNQEQPKEEEKKEESKNDGEQKNEEEQPKNEEEPKKEEEKKDNEENAEENEEKDPKEEERKAKEEEEKREREEKLNKKMEEKENKSIQAQIEQETIQIEQKKIDLRIMKERLIQKQKLYNQLQGKPVEKTSEEKEKERREKKKANKNHKFTDPIERKKGREKQLSDEREKIEKENIKKKSEFQKLTTDINELLISNTDLKKEIVNLRKRKNEIRRKKEEMEKEIELKKIKLQNISKNNEVSKSQIMHKEYQNTVTEGAELQKDFEEERNELEEEYQKIREEYIKREREAKKENAKKRNMAALALSNKSSLKSSRDKDIELELKRMADEQIMDRIPILEMNIEKWRAINSFKKNSIQVYQQNSSKIRDAFNKLTKCMELDSFHELPLVFRKTEQQMSNINIYKEKLEVENDKLQYEKDLINSQIDLLFGKKKNGISQTSKFIKEKKKNIEIIEECGKNFKKEIDIRMQFIEKLYPETKSFLLKLDNTFLSDFIANKINIDDTSEFTEKTIDKYISNVQDYYSLVQEWDKSTKEKKEGENEIDRLREEIKQKLGKFEHNRLISQELDEKMKLDYKKGLKLEEIIKKNSNKIVLDIQNPYSKSAVFTKTKKKMNMSVASTEPGNYRYGNDSTMTNKQQSSIIYPNNSSTTTKNNKSKAQNEKIAETA